MPQPASVLVLSTYYPPVLGGAETASAQLAEFLAARGHRVTVVTKRTDGSAPPEESRNGVRVIRVQPDGERTAWGKWLALPFMLREITRQRHMHDVVVCIDYRAVGLAALAARGYTQRPVIFQAATDGVLSFAAVRRALTDAGLTSHWFGDIITWPLQRLYDGADAYPCISRAIEAETLLSGVSRDRVHYLPNPVDTRLFSAVSAERKTELRERANIGKDARVAVIAGRLSREKGQMDALRAWKEVTVPNSMLVLVGPDMPGHPWDIGREARGFVAQEGLSSRVKFVGGVTPAEVPDWLRVADAAIQPSHFEAFGTSAIEAMAVGLPVIASDVGGLKDFVETGVNGMRVPAQQPQAFADAINRVLGDDNFRSVLAAGAAATAPRFDTEVVLSAFEALIEKLAAIPPA